MSEHDANDFIDTIYPRSAVISECGRYRYRLTRRLGMGERIACFIMLNPSTADARLDDPTIRRCIGFTKAWGCDLLFVANLFGFRATDPAYLQTAGDPIGPRNNDFVISAACRAHESGGLVVAAWGVNGALLEQDRLIVSLLRKTLGISLMCLGETAESYPRHPLYVAGNTPLQEYIGRRVS